MKQSIRLPAFSFVVVVILSGCTATTHRTASGGAFNAELLPPPALVFPSSPSTTDAFAGEARPRRASPVPGTATHGDSEIPDQIRMLIWRGSLSMEVSSVSNAVSRVTDIAKQSGGYVESTSDSGDERANVILRVPVDSLTPAIASLESIGKVTSRSVSSQDVTEQYVDIDARLKTMLALRDRLRALLDKAQDVKDILAIEKELGRVQADIDSMQARLNTLKGRVELASVRVSIRRKRILGPVGHLLKGAWWTVKKLVVIQD